MQLDDKQLNIPFREYTNTKAAIEALTGVVAGCIAYATDTDELGTYDGADWQWGSQIDAIDAEDVNIADAGDYYAATTVEGALQEVGAAVMVGNFVALATMEWMKL